MSGLLLFIENESKVAQSSSHLWRYRKNNSCHRQCSWYSSMRKPRERSTPSYRLKICIRRHHLSKLRTATRQPFPLDRLVLPHLYPDKLCTQIFLRHSFPSYCTRSFWHGIYRSVYPGNFPSWKKSCTSEFRTSYDSSWQAAENGTSYGRFKHHKKKNLKTSLLTQKKTLRFVWHAK